MPLEKQQSGTDEMVNIYKTLAGVVFVYIYGATEKQVLKAEGI